MTGSELHRRIQFTLRQLLTAVTLPASYLAAIGATSVGQYSVALLVFGIAQAISHCVLRRIGGNSRLIDLSLAIAIAAVCLIVWLSGNDNLVALAIGAMTENHFASQLESLFGTLLMVGSIGVFCSAAVVSVCSIGLVPGGRYDSYRLVWALAILAGMSASWKVMAVLANIPVEP